MKKLGNMEKFFLTTLTLCSSVLLDSGTWGLPYKIRIGAIFTGDKKKSSLIDLLDDGDFAKGIFQLCYYRVLIQKVYRVLSFLFCG